MEHSPVLTGNPPVALRVRHPGMTRSDTHWVEGRVEESSPSFVHPGVCRALAVCWVPCLALGTMLGPGYHAWPWVPCLALGMLVKRQT